MSINRRMDKEEVVHKHHGILAIKTKELMALAATWMDIDSIMLSEVSKTGWNISHKKERSNGICSNMDGPRNYAK